MLNNETNSRGEAAEFIAGRKTVKAVLLALFILSLFSIYIALALVASKTTEVRPMVENMWLFFIPLPIPLASLILGIIYKIKGLRVTKNIVVGIIFNAPAFSIWYLLLYVQRSLFARFFLCKSNRGKN